ncbi:glycosyltransferase family 2 protein [soil metagenome]
MSTEHRITVIIPCLNEEANIRDHVRGVFDAGSTLPDGASLQAVIVVDNGSTDGTVEEAAEAGARVVLEPERGYGRACMTGALSADGTDVLVFMDGDRSDDPAELPIVVLPLLHGVADLVVGSRLQGSLQPGALATQQRFGNWLGRQGLSRLYGIHLTDFGPFRAIRRADLLSLDMQEMTYGWPIEMIARAAKADLRVVNVPVSWRRRAGGESKVSGDLKASLKTGYRYGSTLVRCR